MPKKDDCKILLQQIEHSQNFVRHDPAQTKYKRLTPLQFQNWKFSGLLA